jgi:MFS family permease
MLSVLRNRDYRLFETSVMLATLAAEILTIAVGWTIYDITNDAFDLGLVGLAQFMPTLLLVMVTGTLADRLPRRRIMAACLAVEFVSIAGIFAFVSRPDPQVAPLLGLMALIGAGRAFMSPAAQALAPNLVRREEIAAAISCSTSTWQLCAIAGPALGGFLYGLEPILAYGTALAMIAAAIAAILGVRHVERPKTEEVDVLGALLGGIRYMLREKVVLGATTFDLFAVLLGSTVVLLPVYARDVLVGDPWEFGLLRASIGIGALGMALFLGLVPIRRHAGPLMFGAVILFGFGTISFGLSTSMSWSIVALAAMGASDMVSVYIREVLIQLWTPDQLRGRVTAVNALLVTASNEMGSFRAGWSASLVGPVTATLLGGACTLAVTLVWLLLFPALRRADSLTDVEEPTAVE